MASDPILTIGYSTLAERIGNIQPPSLDIPHEILISIQNPNNIKFELPTSFTFRKVESNLKGVAKSRNAVLDNSDTRYLLFADDEIQFDPKNIVVAIKFMEENPDCDLILAQTVDTDGNLRKNYPEKMKDLNSLNSGKAATYEMLIRTQSIKDKEIRFDENFGAGVKNYLGDEYIFITDLLRKGGRAIFLPLTLAVHPAESSGSKWGSERDLKARAAIFTRVFGKWAVPMRALFFIKSYRKMPGIRRFIKFTLNR